MEPAPSAGHHADVAAEGGDSLSPREAVGLQRLNHSHDSATLQTIYKRQASYADREESRTKKKAQLASVSQLQLNLKLQARRSRKPAAYKSRRPKAVLLLRDEDGSSTSSSPDDETTGESSEEEDSIPDWTDRDQAAEQAAAKLGGAGTPLRAAPARNSVLQPGGTTLPPVPSSSSSSSDRKPDTSDRLLQAGLSSPPLFKQSTSNFAREKTIEADLKSIAKAHSIKSARGADPLKRGHRSTTALIKLDKRLSLGTAIGDYNLRRALHGFLALLLFFNLSCFTMYRNFAPGHSDAVNYMQKYILQSLDFDSASVTTEMCEDFITGDGGLLAGLIGDERPGGGIYFADEVRLLAVRVLRVTRVDPKQEGSPADEAEGRKIDTDSGSGGGGGGSSSSSSSSSSSTGPHSVMLCDNFNGGSGRRRAPSNASSVLSDDTRHNCGAGMDASYDLRCIVPGKDTRQTRSWTHNAFFEELYGEDGSLQELPAGTLIHRQESPSLHGWNSTALCEDSGHIWLYHASQNSSDGFHRYLKTMQSKALVKTEDVGEEVTVIPGGGSGNSAVVVGKASNASLSVHWRGGGLKRQKMEQQGSTSPASSNTTTPLLRVVSVEADDSGAPVLSGLVVLSDGSTFTNPSRMSLVQDDVQSLTLKILGYSAVADSLVETEVNFYRANAGRMSLYVGTSHLPMSSPFVRTQYMGALSTLWLVFALSISIWEGSQLVSHVASRLPKTTVCDQICSFFTSITNCLTLVAFLSRWALVIYYVSIVASWQTTNEFGTTRQQGSSVPPANVGAGLDTNLVEWMEGVFTFEQRVSGYNLCIYLFLGQNLVAALQMARLFRFHEGTATWLSTMKHSISDMGDLMFTLIWVGSFLSVFLYVWLGFLTGHDEFRFIFYAVHNTFLALLGFYQLDAASAQGLGTQGYTNVGISHMGLVLFFWATFIYGYFFLTNYVIAIISDAFQRAKGEVSQYVYHNDGIWVELYRYFAFYRWYIGCYCYRCVRHLNPLGLKSVMVTTESDNIQSNESIQPLPPTPKPESPSSPTGGAATGRAMKQLRKQWTKRGQESTPRSPGERLKSTKDMRQAPGELLTYRKMKFQFGTGDDVWEREDDKMSKMKKQFIKSVKAVSDGVTLWSTLVLIALIVVQASEEISGFLPDDRQRSLQEAIFAFSSLVCISLVLCAGCGFCTSPEFEVPRLPLNCSAEKYLLYHSKYMQRLTSHLMVSSDDWARPYPALEWLVNAQLKASQLGYILGKKHFDHDDDETLVRRASAAMWLKQDKMPAKEFFQKLQEHVKKEVELQEQAVKHKESVRRMTTEAVTQQSVPESPSVPPKPLGLQRQRPPSDETDVASSWRVHNYLEECPILKADGDPHVYKELEVIKIISRVLQWRAGEPWNPSDHMEVEVDDKNFSEVKTYTRKVENLLKRKEAFERLRNLQDDVEKAERCEVPDFVDATLRTFGTFRTDQMAKSVTVDQDPTRQKNDEPWIKPMLRRTEEKLEKRLDSIETLLRQSQEAPQQQRLHLQHLQDSVDLLIKHGQTGAQSRVAAMGASAASALGFSADGTAQMSTQMPLAGVPESPE